MTEEQIQEAAKLYVLKRLEQDGIPRRWEEHVDMARAMANWREVLQMAEEGIQA